MKKIVKMIREIKNIAMKKLPSTKRIGDRMERAEGQGMMSITSSELVGVTVDFGVPMPKEELFCPPEWPIDVG